MVYGFMGGSMHARDEAEKGVAVGQRMLTEVLFQMLQVLQGTRPAMPRHKDPKERPMETVLV